MELREKVSQLQLAHWRKQLWKMWGTTLEAVSLTQCWCKHLCLSSILPSIIHSSIQTDRQSRLDTDPLPSLLSLSLYIGWLKPNRESLLIWLWDDFGSVARAGGLTIIKIKGLLVPIPLNPSLLSCLWATLWALWCNHRVQTCVNEWVRGFCEVQWVPQGHQISVVYLYQCNNTSIVPPEYFDDFLLFFCFFQTCAIF